jgi:arsenate reductase
VRSGFASGIAGKQEAEACPRFGEKQKSDMEDVQMNDRPFNVLFLCTGNSARSILAEAILNRTGQGRFRAFSAGSHPKGEVHPFAIQLLRSLNHDTSFARSKGWEEFAMAGAPAMDFVFTVCDDAANEACPVWPGQPMSAHWGVPDPAAAEGTDAEKHLAFAEAYRMLDTRISIFTSLPMKAIDKLALQRRLDEIGGSLPKTG